jgi:transcriptional regulator with XRE-family HTH domain
MIGRTRESVGLYERDRVQPPVDVIDRIAAVLGVDLDQLLTERVDQGKCHQCLSFTVAERNRLQTCWEDARCPRSAGVGRG